MWFFLLKVYRVLSVLALKFPLLRKAGKRLQRLVSLIK